MKYYASKALTEPNLMPGALYYKTLRNTEKEKIKDKFKELFSP